MWDTPPAMALGSRLLVNRNVGLLFAAQVVSQAGDSIYQIGLLWLTYELTGSRTMTGLVASAAYLPYLLFAVPGGALSDRWPRRSIMMLSDAARILLVLLLPLLHGLGALTVIALGLVTFGIESFSALFYPARDALLPAISPRERLPHANALLQTSWQLAFLLGPSFAALLLPHTGLVHLFTADAATFLVSLLAIAAIRVPRTPRAERKGAPWTDIREGLRFAWRDPRMRLILGITALNNLILMGPAIVGMVLFVRDTLGLDARSGAWIGACYAGGALIGAPLIARFGSRVPLGRLLLVGVILDGLTFLPLLWVRSFRGTALTIVVHSLVIPLITVSRATLIQRTVPDRLQGRMFALVQAAVVGMTALSTTLTGIVGEHVGAPWIFGAISLLAAATALPGFFSKALREER
jgi:MFS family permease